MILKEILSSFKEETLAGYRILFQQQWPAWISGIFLAFLALIVFMWWHTWGIAGGYNNWGNWLFYSLGLSGTCPEKSPLLNGMSVSNIGLIAGAMASALLGNQFRINKAPLFEYGKGLVGGGLMGLGAALAAGCNVGGFYSALGMFDLAGLGMMVGLFLGAFMGLRYLLWEVGKIAPKTSGKQKAERQARVNWSKVRPPLGILLFILVIAAFQIYSSLDLTQMGGLLFFGFLIGLVMHRGRFCFANAFREPFMTGDSKMMRAVIISLMVYIVGSAVIKWSYIQPPNSGIYHPFLVGSLVGGMIFGFGMLLAGGCASGALWRAGEGQTKLWVAIVGFFLSNSLSTRFLQESGIKAYLGKSIFIPDYLGWQLSFLLFYIIFLAMIILLLWNEKTERFVIF